MTMLEKLGIKPIAHPQRCPLCHQVTLIYHEGDPGIWFCSGCGEAGDSITGWGDSQAMNRGYLPIKDDELTMKVWDAHKKGLVHGVRLGLRDLDILWKPRKGEFTIITGLPGHGKSELLDQLSMMTAALHGWKFGVFSPENDPHEMHVAKMLEKFTGKGFYPSSKNQMTFSEMEDGRDWLNEHFYFIHPAKQDIDSILQTADYLARKKKLDCLIVDPWNMIEKNRGQQSEHDYAAFALPKIVNFCRKRGLTVWLGAHPKKIGRQDDGREAVPSPSDISGSQNFYNMSDNIITVWRDKYTDDPAEKERVYVYVQKVRWKVTGETGETILIYDRETGLYRGNAAEAPFVTIGALIRKKIS
jgi:twinkle protein